MEKNSKIIADFMNHYENMGNKGLFYHSDWNWLMEVVEKIKKDSDEDDFLDKLTTTDLKKTIDIINTLENCFRKSYLSIESVYNACVEFINFYNKQKEK